jgi:hypothetical protein
LGTEATATAASSNFFIGIAPFVVLSIGRCVTVRGFVILRQTFVRRRHRPTTSASCCSSTATPPRIPNWLSP